MEFSAEIIASFLGGEVVGDKNIVVNTVSKIEEGKSGSLSFLANSKYESYIYTTESSIVIVDRDFKPQKPINATLVMVDDAYGSFAKLLDLYASSKPQKEGVSTLSAVSASAVIDGSPYIGEYTVIADNVKIGSGAKIYPQVYIGDNVTIGTNVLIYPGVKISEGSVIGNNVIIHSGVVIGADGFGFAPDGEKFRKIPQIGNVIIEDDVEIGACTCIDRATMGSTIISKGVKFDNLIQIGHNVTVGSNTVIAGQVGIAGSTKIGKSCMFGGQVGIAGHISIADGVHIASKSGVASSVKKKGDVIMGSPAFAAKDFQRASIVFKSLPDMRLKISSLERQLAELKALVESK